MILFIYILGVLMAWFLMYLEEKYRYKKEKTYKFTLGNLLSSIFFSLFPWIVVAACLISLSDKIILVDKSD